VAAERPTACLNCGSTDARAYCPECGQRNVELRAPVGTLVREALEDTFSFDSRLGRTLRPFLARPGHLTAEWCAGRRTRFSSPLRLYLIASAVFFVVVAIVPGESGVGVRVGDVRVGDVRVAGTSTAPAQDAPAVGEPGRAADRAAAPEASEAEREEAHRALRGMGAAGRALDARLGELERQGLPEATRRVSAAYREWVPRVMFFLVPVLALLLELLWRRRWLTEHLVFSLHAHAVAFVFFTLAALAGRRGGAFALLALLAWLALAVRRVYGDRWSRIALKVPVLALLYGIALGVGLAAVATVALLVA
jgi:hypothetical protein